MPCQTLPLLKAHADWDTALLTFSNLKGTASQGGDRSARPCTNSLVGDTSFTAGGEAVNAVNSAPNRAATLVWSVSGMEEWPPGEWIVTDTLCNMCTAQRGRSNTTRLLRTSCYAAHPGASNKPTCSHVTHTPPVKRCAGAVLLRMWMITTCACSLRES